MFALKKAMELSPLVYVTRDIERALGEPATTKNYYIISNHSAFAKSIAHDSPNVLLIRGQKKLDTRELLERPETSKLLSQLNKPRLLVFKNTPQIEKICSEHGWSLINPPAELASKVEQKISQVSWLGPLQKYLPPHKVMTCEELTWPLACHFDRASQRAEKSLNNNERDSSTSLRSAQNDSADEWKKHIIQFNSAHTGSGTILVKSAKQIKELAEKFPDRDARVTKFIDGPAFTNNNVVWGSQVMVGNINYQITGLSPFTDNPFATIGNDWALPGKILNAKQIKQYGRIATDVGKRLARDGWKGLFGIDVILEKKSGKLYLIEINARQPASTTFESQLQENKKTRKQENNLTTFDAHLAALLGLPSIPYSLLPINDGAQIIYRVPAASLRGAKRRGNPLAVRKIKRLKDYKIIPYDNTKPGEDLLRIQSNSGIMTEHNKLNKIGKKIVAIISNI